MSRIIVERTFDPPITMEQLQAVAERMKACLETYRVSWLRSFCSQDRRRMVCEYEAPDAQAVRDVQREAEAKYDRVWVADVFGG